MYKSTRKCKKVAKKFGGLKRKSYLCRRGRHIGHLNNMDAYGLVIAYRRPTSLELQSLALPCLYTTHRALEGHLEELLESFRKTYPDDYIIDHYFERTYTVNV